MLAALLRIGWSLKRQSGSHRTLERPSWPDFVFAFHDNEEIGPRMLARIAKGTGLTSGSLARTRTKTAVVPAAEAYCVPAGAAMPRIFAGLILSMRSSSCSVKPFARRTFAQFASASGCQFELI